jgi:Na+-transporting NADH:ubiquinone oxidoreductase subunit NqrC
MTNKIRYTIISLFLVILVALNIFLFVLYYNSTKELRGQKLTAQTCQHNQKILDFAKLFFDKVIKADTAVSFDDRIMLENAVRDVNDQAVIDQWRKFTNAKTAQQTQDEVRNLLDLLINKIAY